MQWLIQNTGISPMFVDEQAAKVLYAVKERNLPWAAIGVIPFTHEITGLDEADPCAPTMLYCSTELASLAASWDTFRPGVYHREEWFNPTNWRGKRSDILNDNLREITVRELRDRWVDEPTFVKSVRVKKLTGMVIEPVKQDKDYWIIEHSDLDGNEILVAGPAIRLEREWRFFAVNGDVVTGSTYRKDGYRSIFHPVSAAAWDHARDAVKEWMPNPTIVIDIARTDKGEYKVIEFNCVNSSGVYNSDAGKLVDALGAA
jgi:hypothetical protein